MRRRMWSLVVLSCMVVLVSCDSTECPVAPETFNGIADLQVVESSLDAITLGWTAPVFQGESLFYDIRYLDAPSMDGQERITEALWAVADTVAGEPVPAHSGYQESYVIGGLPSDVTYFAAMRIERVSDGEMSDISNTASATTYLQFTECRAPALAIPDADPAGVYDVIPFPNQLEIAEVQVALNITHTWKGDLIVELTSPGGTTVRLHNRSGSLDDNIVGTYGLDLVVDGPGSLDDFIGELSQGNWTLWVSDNAGLDTGVLNGWCVVVTGHTP